MPKKMVGGSSPKFCPSTRSDPESSRVTWWLVADDGDGAHGTSRYWKLPAAYGLATRRPAGRGRPISMRSGIVGYVFGVIARDPPAKVSRPAPPSVVHGAAGVEVAGVPGPVGGRPEPVGRDHPLEPRRQDDRLGQVEVAGAADQGAGVLRGEGQPGQLDLRGGVVQDGGQGGGQPVAVVVEHPQAGDDHRPVGGEGHAVGGVAGVGPGLVAGGAGRDDVGLGRRCRGRRVVMSTRTV